MAAATPTLCYGDSAYGGPRAARALVTLVAGVGTIRVPFDVVQAIKATILKATRPGAQTLAVGPVPNVAGEIHPAGNDHALTVTSSDNTSTSKVLVWIWGR